MSYWATLGLQDGAPLTEVKSAFRNLAKQFHPDLNPGCSKSERRFKEISAAYDVLKNGGPKTVAAPTSARSTQRRAKQTFYVSLSLKEAAWGLTWVNTDRGVLPLPAGVRDGDTVHYDAYTDINVSVANSHGDYIRRGDDLCTSHTVTQRELESGTLAIPKDHPGMKSSMFRLDPNTMKDGVTVRVAGKGMPRLAQRGGGYGDLYVKLTVIPTPSLWARIKQRDTWNSGEQLFISTILAFALVFGVMAISFGIVALIH